MKELIYDKGKIIIADSPEELSGQQFIDIAGILHNKRAPLQASIEALRVLCNKTALSFYLLPNEVKLNCLPHVQWVFEDLNITAQLIPEYNGFYGPAAEFKNLTLSEFYFSENAWQELVKKKTDDALCHLVTILYRMPKKDYNKQKDEDGDIRQPFNNSTVPYYKKQISQWPKEVLQAIAIWYDACREKLRKDNPEIYPQTEVQSADADEADMFGILRGLAGGKYGDFEKVEKLPLYTALYELNFLIAENKRLEAEVNSSK